MEYIKMEHFIAVLCALIVKFLFVLHKSVSKLETVFFFNLKTGPSIKRSLFI